MAWIWGVAEVLPWDVRTAKEGKGGRGSVGSGDHGRGRESEGGGDTSEGEYIDRYWVVKAVMEGHESTARSNIVYLHSTCHLPQLVQPGQQPSSPFLTTLLVLFHLDLLSDPYPASYKINVSPLPIRKFESLSRGTSTV